ncbi:MAG: hypothetical protein OXI83_10330 [Gemmatimonadota bacterium]|nr:hypothetical protein [Gemmatimonadota bacterium]
MTADQFREILREELQPIHRRLDSLESAILVLANHVPGSVPGHKSYVRKKIEETFAEAGQ